MAGMMVVTMVVWRVSLKVGWWADQMAALMVDMLAAMRVALREQKMAAWKAAM